jgi:hypothetical protein
MISGHVDGRNDRVVIGSVWAPKLRKLRRKGVGGDVARGDVARGEDVEAGRSGRSGVTGKKQQIMVEVIWGMSGDTCREVRGGEKLVGK